MRTNVPMGSVLIYVDELVEWGAPGTYRGEHAAQAERVGARHGHRWCHMFADQPECPELHAFARRLGLRREWFQHGNHYDLVATKRAKAVAAGAIELGRAESVVVWQRQSEAARMRAQLVRWRCLARCRLDGTELQCGKLQGHEGGHLSPPPGHNYLVCQECGDEVAEWEWDDCGGRILCALCLIPAEQHLDGCCCGRCKARHEQGVA